MLSMRFTLFFATITTLSGQLSLSEAHLWNTRPEASNQSIQSYLAGRIESGNSADAHRLRIQLLPMGSRRVIAETNPSQTGSFEIQSGSGVHELRVVTMQGDIIHTQSVSLPFASTLVIDLRQGASSGSSDRPVSLARLQHKVPKRAEKLYVAAHDASEKGDRNKAISLLSQALAIDPLYFEAINNLGVQMIREERIEEAAALFTRAVDIDASDPLAETNLAFAFLRLRRFVEAEEAARAGVRADGLSSRARFYLAISMLEQNKPRKEILFHLSKASSNLEPARRLMQKLQNEANTAAQ